MSDKKNSHQDEKYSFLQVTLSPSQAEATACRAEQGRQVDRVARVGRVDDDGEGGGAVRVHHTFTVQTREVYC